MLKKTFFIFLIILQSYTYVIADICKEPNYDNELIVELYLKKYKLSDGLIVYKNKNNKILYPIVELLELFDIKFESDEGYFVSNLFEKQKTLEIDIQNKYLEINGTKYKDKQFIDFFSSEHIACYEDTIYIEDAILEDLLHSTIDFSQNYLRVKFKSKRRYPVDIKKIKYELINNASQSNSDRYLSWSEKLINKYKSNDNEIEKVDNFKYFSINTLSLNLRTNSKKKSSARVKTHINVMEHDIKLMASKQSKEKYKYNIVGKKVILNEKIKPYIAEYDFGDISSSSLSGTIGSYSGKGIKITNKQKNRANSNYINLSGVLEEGWFVELYVNNKLESFAQSNQYNKYYFDDIKLKGGNNIIKYVFYGPLGEIEEKEEEYYVNDTYKTKGKFWYEMQYTKDDIDHKYDIFNLGATYGISSYITSSLRFWNINLYDKKMIEENRDKNNDKILSPKIRFRLYDWLKYDIEHPFYIDNSSNYANMMNINIKPFENFSNLNIRYDKYSKNFYQVAKKRKIDKKVSFNTNIPLLFIKNSIVYKKEYKKTKNKVETKSKYSYSQNLINKLRFKLNYTNYETEKKKEYEVIFSKRDKIISHIITVNAEYSQKNTKNNGINRFAYNNTFKFDERLNLTSRFNYSSVRKRYSLDSSLSYKNRHFKVGFNIKQDELKRHTWSATFETKILNFNKSIYDVQMIKDLSINKGIALIDVFLTDEDNNIIQRITKATININNKSLGVDDEIYQHTDTNTTIIPNIVTNKSVIVELDEKSLPDVSWKVTASPKRIVFLPGKVEHLVFYVRQTGEIDGVITYDNKDGNSLEYKNKTVYLKDIFYNTVKETKTEDDGYYIFQQVPAGEYFIDIDKKMKTKLKIHIDKEKTVNINKKQLFYFDQNIHYKHN